MIEIHKIVVVSLARHEMHTDTNFYGEIPSCEKQPRKAHVA